MTNKTETMGFQTEVKRMLHLVVHSLYSNKEIFMRELISNASDALDKLRFLALSNSALYEGSTDLQISVDFNETLKTLTITDNGIGMTREEVIENLGTIAKSGTLDFMNHLSGEQAKDSLLIGQFGVGFYSSFIVADKVTVKTRKAGLKANEGVLWESAGEGEFNVTDLDKAVRGTEITLHLKSDAEEFLNQWRLKTLITKYSDHISWPIVMKKIETDEKEDKKTTEFETVNKATALWTLQKSEISEDEYKGLYNHLSHDMKEPLAWTHNHVEGKSNYISLLYIPSEAPFDLWQQQVKHGLKLYVKRVFIMDDVAQFVPRYLRFVKGIIDASDLPLNVSREILQDNKQVETIRSACTKRVLTLLEKMAENEPEKYQIFWEKFGLVLKEGPIEDYVNKDAIAKLLRFASTETRSEKQTVSFADYLARMKEGQDKIYYITASSFNAANHSPHLEIFKKKGLEVLLLSDQVDEWLVGYLSEIEGKKLQSISKGKVDLDDEKDLKQDEETLAPMLKQISTLLSERVKAVQLTNRLIDSPACIIAAEDDMGLEMQRILQAAGQKVPMPKPIFEINPDHPLIKRLHGMTDDVAFEKWVIVLFEQAVLAEGGQLDNPADFVNRVNELLIAS